MTALRPLAPREEQSGSSGALAIRTRVRQGARHLVSREDKTPLSWPPSRERTSLSLAASGRHCGRDGRRQFVRNSGTDYLVVIGVTPRCAETAIRRPQADELPSRGEAALLHSSRFSFSAGGQA